MGAEQFCALFILGMVGFSFLIIGAFIELEGGSPITKWFGILCLIPTMLFLFSKALLG